MDLKFRGISWAGNFYQKFERVCNEVDSIVNQEAVKYVENQVQSFGGNMKKFCSEVISDILPPSVNSVKHDLPEKSMEKTAAVDTHIQSEMDIEEYSTYKVNEHSHFQPSEVDPIMKQVDHALSGLHFAEELNPLTFMDPIEALDSDLDPMQIANALTNSNLNLKFEENTVTKNFCFDDDVSELASPKVEDWFGDALWDTFVEFDDEFPRQLQDGTTVATPVLGEDFQSNDNAGMVNSDASSEKNTVDAVDSMISSPVMESCLLESPNETSATSVDIAVFSSHNMLPSSLSTTTKSTENKVPEMVSISSGSALPSDLPDSLCALRCTEIKSSVVFPEENKIENADISKRSPPLRESVLLENTMKNASPLAESCHSSIDVARCISHSALTTTTFSERVSEMGLMSSSIVESSASIGLLGVSDHEVNASSMETIDLCDDAKLEDSSNYVDNNALYDVSRTLRKHRSYKQMLRDAFTSKKRLVKEYEQLAIWFGDADMGSNKESEQRPLTFATTTRSEDLQVESDSGWEVL